MEPWGKLHRSSYFVTPGEFLQFFRGCLLLSGVLCLLAVKTLGPSSAEHNTWHNVLGYNHAIELFSSPPGRFIFLPMWTYGSNFLVAGVRLSLQRSAIEGRLSVFQTNLKYAVCGLWVASVCTFPLVAAFDQPKVSFSMILYSVICLCFHLYGLFEFLEYKQKGEHGFAFWIVFRFLLTAAMLGMMMYDCVAFIERGGDRDFEPPVPPWILQLIEYSVYLSLPLTDIFKPATDSMEVRTTVTAGTIAKNVGPPPTRGALAPASPRVQSQALLFQAVTSQPTLQHISSSRTLAPRLSMTRQVSWMPSCVTRYESVRTPGAVYDAIVFEGGGVKGAAYAGALRRLEEKGLLGKIKKIGGTSIGAHLAVLLAVGYDSEELAEGLRSMPWEQVFDMDRGFGWRTRAVWNVITRLGACRGEFILKYVEAQIRKKVGQHWITFQQLYDRTGVDLRLGVSNLTLGEFQFLSKDTHGDMPVAVGAVASSTLPFIFPPLRWGGHMYIDGAAGGNLPTKAFPGTRLLACKLQTATDDQANDLETFSGYIAGVADLVFSFAQCVGGECSDKNASVQERARRREYVRGMGVDIVHINCGDCGLMETVMPLERMNNIIELGYKSMSQFLDSNVGSEDAKEHTEDTSLV